MMKRNKFGGVSTNTNRAKAGSERGLAGREYPIAFAQRLNSDSEFLAAVCNEINKDPKLFSIAEAGSSIRSTIPGIAGKSVKNKTNLILRWHDGTSTNIRVKNSNPAQIHLEITPFFIRGFEKQFSTKIPSKVRDALLLFTGRHENQKEILDSVPIAYVGKKVRELERKYHNRLTLASIHGYDEGMVAELLEWIRHNVGYLFLFCFSLGEARDRSTVPEYLLFHDTDEVDSSYRIFNISSLFDKISIIPQSTLTDLISPGDEERIGSTISLPFGKMQYHLWELQFRHSVNKLEKIADYVKPKKNTFGSKQKESGHRNEECIAEMLNNNKRFREHFCDRIDIKESEFVQAIAGGKHATKEDSIIGRMTPGKTDISVRWKDGSTTNISIKKNRCGQVYLVTAKNFIAAYEAQFKKSIPDNVKRALSLFIGEAVDSKSILDRTDLSIDGSQARKLAHEQNNRLMFDVIYKYDPNMATDFLEWIKNEIASIFELCFSSGAVKDRNKWANILWYKNLVDADEHGLDYMVPISQIKIALKKNKDNIVVKSGPKNAGSTLQLPFGHLQYHLKQLEFYQQLNKIQALLESVSG